MAEAVGWGAGEVTAIVATAPEEVVARHGLIVSVGGVVCVCWGLCLIVFYGFGCWGTRQVRKKDI